MATLVRFLKHPKEYPDTTFAYFPLLNFNKRLYGNTQKMSYAHIGQHGACHIDYANECTEATKEEFQSLLNELKSIGYDLKVLNRS